MRTMVSTAPGLEHLIMREAPVPIPGPDEVLVRLRAASLNFRDILNIEGREPGYTWDLRRGPFVPASDGCGTVVQLGPGVSGVAVGDRVAGLFFQGWIDGKRPTTSFILGRPGPGMLQEYVCLRADGVAHLPAALSDAEAATLPCAALTAWHALEEGGVGPGSRVLVLGTGGVSVAALQFAKMRGATVAITSSSDAKLAQAHRLGADHLINYQAFPRWADEVRKLLDGGVDCVVEVGGCATIAESMRALAQEGSIVVVGRLGGALMQAPLGDLGRYEGRMAFIRVGSRAMFQTMSRAIEAGRMKPIVDTVFALDDARGAYEYFARQQHVGKICVTVNQS